MPYIKSYDDYPGLIGGDDPVGVWNPIQSYVELRSRSYTVTAGQTYTFSIYLKSTSDLVLYLRLGTTRKAVSVGTSWNRFEVTATATTASLAVAIETLEGDYSSVSVCLAFDQLEEGDSASTYTATAKTPDYTVSSTGAVHFATVPSGELTWDGSYYDTSTPLEVATPFQESELADINFCQSADVLILTHMAHPPQWLGRYSDSNWVLQPFDFKNGPFGDINVDTAVTITPSALTGNVTLTSPKSIFTGSTLGKLVRLEAKDAGTPWEVGKTVAIGDVRVASGNYYVATTAGTTGTLRPTHTQDSASDGGVTWAYHDQGFGIARITAVSGTTATATVLTAFPHSCTGTASYKWAFSPWSDAEGYPSVATFHQQRLFLAGSPSKPNTFWASRTGAYKDFGTSNPIADDDSLTFKMVANQVNRVSGLISLGSLLTLTEDGTWSIGDTDALTPSNINARLQGYRGASFAPPLGVGNAVVYVEAKGQNLRDMTFEWASNAYNGNNLNAFASHLVKGHQIVDWCHQPSSSVIWCVREDGILLGCTYMRDQEVCGWHRHDTDGLFEGVCCVCEGEEDILYAVVLRGAKRYIERFESRNVLDVRDGWFVDCGLKFDGANTSSTSITFTLANGVYTATASAPLFGLGLLDQIVLLEGRVAYRWNIVSAETNTRATVVPVRAPLPSHLGTPITAWSRGRKTFSGMGHLEGKTLSVLTDGFACAESVVVSGGSFTLEKPAFKVIAGLPYVSDLETLGVNAGGEQYIDKKRIVNGVRFLVDETWSISSGRDEEHLIDAKTEINTYDDPVEMTSGLVEIRIASTWDKQGRVLIRNSNPLPVSILAVVPEVALGGV